MTAESELTTEDWAQPGPCGVSPSLGHPLQSSSLSSKSDGQPQHVALHGQDEFQLPHYTSTSHISISHISHLPPAWESSRTPSEALGCSWHRVMLQHKHQPSAKLPVPLALGGFQDPGGSCCCWGPALSVRLFCEQLSFP